MPRERARVPRPAAAAQSQAGPSARVPTARSGAIEGRIVGARNALWEGAVRPPPKGPAWADVSPGAMRPPAAKMTRMLAAIRMVIARALPALSTDRTLFRLIRQFQGASRFSAARISVSSLLLERAAMSRKAPPTSAVHFLSIVALSQHACRNSVAVIVFNSPVSSWGCQ